MSIRVIAGSAKGRRLKLVPGDSTRPITDRAKESLFNIIGRDIYGATFLDLYSGTGSVGIEALSRGANHAILIDLNRDAIKTIHANLEVTRLADRATVYRTDALEYVKRQPSQLHHFIYVAPPQYQGLWLETMQLLDKNPEWVQPETVVVVQIDPKERQDVEFEHMVEYDVRKYGKTLLWFFERKEDEETAE